MEDLQNLLERINREGVEKAEAQAREIVAAAEAQAAEIVRKATETAAQFRAAAQRDADAFSSRAAETIRQSARDIVIGVKDAVTALLENLLAKGVDKALADECTAAELVASAIRDLTGPGEITCGPQLASALKSQVSDLKSFVLATDASMGAGFTVKLDGGRIEHAFTADVIAAELAKRLRPDLAKLVQG